MILEINLKFASAMVFRHKLGFTDLLWSIQEQILGVQTSYVPTCTVGTKIYRSFHEFIGQ
jgi:carbamoyl-phosphate synthase large subunit